VSFAEFAIVAVQRLSLRKTARVFPGCPETLFAEKPSRNLSAAAWLFVLAGAEGIEPSTYGFGDRRSAD
jgi:hypothetical protein